MTTDDKPAPKVFISHASDDKDRFVRTFAASLRERGVDAWVDEWEIYPGDSLVDKIFEEGLKAANAVIIILSRNSVDKPWVREELNAGVVNRINRGGRLIPVILDDADVPEVLRSTVWVSIHDLGSYDRELDRIVSAIFDHRPKPPLGPPPSYTSSAVATLPGLSAVDTHVFRAFGEKAIEDDFDFVVQTEDVWHVVEKLSISREDFEDSLQVLEQHGDLEPSKVLAPIPPYFSLTVGGMETYLRRFHPGYPELFRDVGLAIVNRDLKNNYEIADALNMPQSIVRHILRVMHMKRYIGSALRSEGNIDIYEVGAALKRYLRNEAGA